MNTTKLHEHGWPRTDDGTLTVPSERLKDALVRVNSSERLQDPHQAKCDSL